MKTAMLMVCLFAVGASAQSAKYPSPEAAVDALVEAAQSSDPQALLGVLGPEAKELVESGDAVADSADRAKFARAAGEKRRLVDTGKDERTLEVGTDDWPFPIPLVKTKGGWEFDVKAGAQELINRRVGRNELSAVQAALAYVDAQREYYARNPEKSDLPHYARYIASSEGKRDGLFWAAPESEKPSPLGEVFASAQAEGYAPKHGQSAPYHGYIYRIMTAQGRNAEGGDYGYTANGELIGGFALVAYPADYGSSGVMTFIVNHDGVVFQKDLGEKTESAAGAMKAFDPDKTWKRVEAEPAPVPST